MITKDLTKAVVEQAIVDYQPGAKILYRGSISNKTF